jgi:hypothetical protein
MPVRYVMLIYGPEASDPSAGTAEAEQMFAEYGAFSADVKERGAFEAGEALQPISTATTVRVKDGDVLTTDGPFAETKEQLGGFYLLDCKDLDEAIELAARMPHARLGSIEIRPVMEIA